MGRIREFVEYVRGDHDPRFVSPERRILEYFGIIEARPVTLDEARFRAVIAERTIFGEGTRIRSYTKSCKTARRGTWSNGSSTSVSWRGTRN